MNIHSTIFFRSTPIGVVKQGDFMGKPSNQQLASLVDQASHLLARNRLEPATLDEVKALRKKLHQVVDDLTVKEPYNRHLDMLKRFKVALKTREMELKKETATES